MKRIFQTRPVTVWSFRDFWILLLGRALGLAATSMAVVTLLLRVHDGGAGAWAVALVLACFALPTIVSMGVVGHLADTLDSRTLLLAGLGLQALAAAGLAVQDGLVATCGLVAAFALGQALTAPVWSALVPRVVGDDLLGAAIAWQQGVGAVAGPAGAATAGVVYQMAGGRPAFWVVAAASAVVMAAAAAVRTRRHVRRELRAAGRDAGGARPRLLDGVRVVRADALLWPLFGALLVMVVLVEGTNAAEVFLARDAIGATPAEYGFVEFASGLGGIAGAAVAGRLTGDVTRLRACLAGFAVTCLGIALAGTAGVFWAYFALVVALTAGSGLGNATLGALIMGRTPDADRGKVQAGLNGLARAGTLVALTLGGTATTLAGPRAVFVVAGLAGLLTLAGTAVRLARRPAAAPQAMAASASEIH